MNYSGIWDYYEIDGLFGFEKILNECTLIRYLKSGDPTVTEIEIPAECHGFPVTRTHDCFDSAKYLKRVVIPQSVTAIDTASFYDCSDLESVELPDGLKAIRSLAFKGTNLKSVTLPKSLEVLGDMSFAYCRSLESVTFNSAPIFGEKVFVGCEKLPADITLMGLVNSADLTAPFDKHAFFDAFAGNFCPVGEEREHLKYTRPDIFETAVKNQCFKSVDMYVMLAFYIEERDAERLKLIEEHGLLDDRALLDEYTERSIQKGKPEITAYLLDLKKRRFGFSLESEFDEW